MKHRYVIANDSGCYGIGDVVEVQSVRLEGLEWIATDLNGDEFTCYSWGFETDKPIKTWKLF